MTLPFGAAYRAAVTVNADGDAVFDLDVYLITLFRPAAHTLMGVYLSLEPLPRHLSLCAAAAIPTLFGFALYINTLP